MSTEFARAMKTLAVGIAAAGFLFVQQSAAENSGITRFAVKNCTSAPVLVCAYDKTDNSLAIPYDANQIKPGDKKRSSCGSANRCKVMAVVSDSKADITNAGRALVAVATTVGAASIIIAPGAIKKGQTAGDTCKQALKDARKAVSDMTDADAKKKAQAALKRTLDGSWPKYKNYSFVTQGGVSMLVKGNKC